MAGLSRPDIQLSDFLPRNPHLMGILIWNSDNQLSISRQVYNTGLLPTENIINSYETHSSGELLIILE